MSHSYGSHNTSDAAVPESPSHNARTTQQSDEPRPRQFRSRFVKQLITRRALIEHSNYGSIHVSNLRDFPECTGFVLFPFSDLLLPLCPCLLFVCVFLLFVYVICIHDIFPFRRELIVLTFKLFPIYLILGLHFYPLYLVSSDGGLQKRVYRLWALISFGWLDQSKQNG